ncbi:MAG: GxGYxYP family putative glycoside hydrolase [Verrucomicrobiota bacterium]
MQNHNLNYRYNSGYNLLGQYLSLFSGLVVTDPSVPDTLNLATTIAGVTNGLICDPSLLDLLTNAPYNLPVVEDLRGRFTTTYQVYGYLYTNYWNLCTRRIIAGVQPGNHGNIRDYCVAVKAACVWLNPGSVTADATALAPFVSSMKPAGGVWMGWVPNENNDVAWLSQYGIPVLASDYYLNGSLFSGVHTPIDVPPIPPAPPLQNKIYVCFFLSDGDNVAFMQHKMRSLWKDSARGSVPIGWTTSPLACDIDPGMLNYYWSTATTNDCLVSGPSGAGYAKIEHWSAANAIAFAAASAPYMQEGGQTVITVWDSLSTANGRIYGTNCPALAGLIDHGGGYYTTTNKGNVPAMGLVSGANYAGSVASLISGITNTAASWSGTAPMFIPVQGSGWDISPSELLTVANALDSRFVVVRPDTLFLLYRQYRGQPVVVAPAPTNLKAVRRFNGSITLTWTGAANASRYKIARATGSGVETIIATTVTNVFTDAGLDDSTTYYYQVATENLVGLSPFSSEIVVTPQAPAAGSFAAAVMAAKPLAYWPLNETSGIFAYDYANGYDGNYSGGYSLGLSGIPNGGQGFPGSFGAYFDGASGKVAIPSGPFNLTNALTVMAWVKVTNTPSHFSGVVGRGDNSWRMSINTAGRPGANAAHVYGDATGPTSIVSTNWRMLAYTYSGAAGVTNNGLLFVDGVPVVTNSIGAFSGSSLDVWIGGSPDYGNSRILQGGIAQVAVFTNALSRAQVLSLYNIGNGNLPSLSLSPLLAGNLQLTWSGSTLLQATNLAGPWTTNAWTSPSVVTPTNAQMFFRLE